MEPSGLIIIGIISLLGLAITIGVILFFFEFIDNYYMNKAMNSFKEEVTNTVKNSTINLAEEDIESLMKDMNIIIELSNLTYSIVIEIFKNILKDIIIGKNTDINDKKVHIEKIIEIIEKKYPFEGLPSEIRTNLEEINQKNSDVNLKPLIVQIKDLLDINAKENKKQRFYTTLGAMVGVIGLLYALYTQIKDPCLTENTFKTVFNKSDINVTSLPINK